MVHSKRIAVTLPAGPRVEDTINRSRWAEENGIPDAWFSDSGAPDTLTQVAAVAHTTRDIRIGTAVTPVYTKPISMEIPFLVKDIVKRHSRIRRQFTSRH